MLLNLIISLNWLNYLLLRISGLQNEFDLIAFIELSVLIRVIRDNSL